MFGRVKFRGRKNYVRLVKSTGLDYSDVIFASAKFRAVAKIEKTSTATCFCPQFESSHRQKFIYILNICLLSTVY